MVRFIIKIIHIMRYPSLFIYIPIWLDLLLLIRDLTQALAIDLHSNMVRFIIKEIINKLNEKFGIYIPIWLDLLFIRLFAVISLDLIFTFQYG